MAETLLGPPTFEEWSATADTAPNNSGMFNWNQALNNAFTFTSGLLGTQYTSEQQKQNAAAAAAAPTATAVNLNQYLPWVIVVVIAIVAVVALKKLL